MRFTYDWFLKFTRCAHLKMANGLVLNCTHYDGLISRRQVQEMNGCFRIPSNNNQRVKLDMYPLT